MTKETFFFVQGDEKTVSFHMGYKRKGGKADTIHLGGEEEGMFFELFIKHQIKIVCPQENPQMLLRCGRFGK